MDSKSSFEALRKQKCDQKTCLICRKQFEGPDYNAFWFGIPYESYSKAFVLQPAQTPENQKNLFGVCNGCFIKLQHTINEIRVNEHRNKTSTESNGVVDDLSDFILKKALNSIYGVKTEIPESPVQQYNEAEEAKYDLAYCRMANKYSFSNAKLDTDFADDLREYVKQEIKKTLKELGY